MAAVVSERSFSYQPALDGLRAVSVLLVLVFHAGFAFMPAGYLGVSVFFTLSGYLITSLLLVEHARTGTVSFRDFYARRVRRLVPASVLCVLAVVVARQLGAFARVPDLRQDVVGAVLQVYNWVQLSGDGSYGEIFGGAASPLEHYWSLAIEEQFYWVWPLVVLGLLRLVGRRRFAAVVVALTVAMSVVAVVIARTAGPDAAYWATPARLPEILVGCALACVLARGRTVPSWMGWWAPAGLVVIVVLAMVLPAASGPAYAGVLPLFALLSASVLAGLQVPGPLRRVLAWAPLVRVGAISYGLYLFHWPVFVLLRERGWRLDTLGGCAVAFALTGALAAGSYLLLEQPVRRATWHPLPTLRIAAVASVVPLLVGLLVSPPRDYMEENTELLAAVDIAPVSGDDLPPLAEPGPAVVTTTTAPNAPAAPEALADLGGAGAGAGAGAGLGISGGIPVAAGPEPPPPETAAPTTTMPLTVPLGPPPSRPVRVLVVGDSTSLPVGEGVAAFARAHPGYAQVRVQWCQGCSFAPDATMMSLNVPGLEQLSRERMIDQLPAILDETRPDVVLLMVTLADAADRQWSPEEGRLSPFDPRFQERMTEAYAAMVTNALAKGVPHVVLVLPPEPTTMFYEPEMNEAGRFAAHRDIIRAAAARFDERVTLLDLHHWLSASGHVGKREWRDDGVHLTDGGGVILAEQFLGPWLVQLAHTG